MCYSLFDKCIMTQWQRFLIFWEQALHVEIYIVLINTTNQVRSLMLVIEYLVATSYELWIM